MSYPYDDYEFFDEPSEFEEFFDDAKEKIISAVKEEFIDEMNRLKRENADLTVIKKNWNRLESEHKAKMAELELKEENLRHKRLTQILDGLMTPYWEATAQYFDIPKCDLCNERRKIPYTLPNGTTAEATCHVCGGKDWRYYPRPLEMNSVVVDRHGKTEEYTVYPYEEEDIIRSVTHDYYYTYDPELTPEENEEVRKKSRITSRRVRFKTEEDCQAWCDWKNGGEK